MDAISEKMAETIERNPNLVLQSSRPRAAEEPLQSSGECGLLNSNHLENVSLEISTVIDNSLQFASVD